MALPYGFEDEREVIEETFHTDWATLGNPAKIEFDNVRFDAKQVQDTNWGRLTIIGGEGEQVGLGTRPCHRIQGQIVMQLFAPEKTGTSAIRALADQFMGIWQDANGRPREIEKGESGRIRTQLGWIVRDGIQEGWYQLRAIVPYTRDVNSTP